MVFQQSVLSQFQCYDREHHAKDRNDPEPHGDLAFMITQLLVMVMQRTHQEYPFALHHISSWCI